MIEWKVSREPDKFYGYFLVDERKIVYVGMSVNPRSREREHSKNKVFSKMIVVDSFESRYDCAIAEKEVIDSLNPIYNVTNEEHAVRQQRGIERAREQGKYTGRAFSLSEEQIEWCREQISLGRPKSHIAKELGISRQTLYSSLGR